MKIMMQRAPDKIAKQLLFIAKQKGRTRNDLVLQILEEWLKRETKQK